METSKLTVKEKIGYGMGDAGCNIIFGAIMLFVNYFYTDIFGLAPALVGVLLLSVRVIDAVTYNGRNGRPHPQQIWSISSMAFVDGFPVRIIQRTDVYHPRMDI